MTYEEGKKKENLKSEVNAKLMFQSKKNFEFVTASDKNKFCSLRILPAGDLRRNTRRHHVNS